MLVSKEGPGASPSWIRGVVVSSGTAVFPSLFACSLTSLSLFPPPSSSLSSLFCVPSFFSLFHDIDMAGNILILNTKFLCKFIYTHIHICTQTFIYTHSWHTHPLTDSIPHSHLHNHAYPHAHAHTHTHTHARTVSSLSADHSNFLQ